MMFPVCSQSCSHLCSHSKPFLFIRVPSVPSTSRARTYKDGAFGALRVNIESVREHWEHWEQVSKWPPAARESV